MGRRRMGRPLHGWLVVDKPAGLTSAAVVAKAKRLTGAAKVGHAGTLDPQATGVLPLAFGEATKIVAFVMEGTKTYRFQLRFGEERLTDDAEGEVIRTSPVRPRAEEIRSVLAEFTGAILQVPPQVSAVKVNGRRAYAMVRAHQAPRLAARTVRIDRLELVGFADGDTAEFVACCGKGAYMRSLARDLARRLGTAGHVARLVRTSVGPFTLARAISLAEAERLWHSPRASELLLPVATALDGIPALAVTAGEAERLMSGRAVPMLPTDNRGWADRSADGKVVCTVASGKPVAVARVADGAIRPLRVLNL